MRRFPENSTITYNPCFSKALIIGNTNAGVGILVGLIKWAVELQWEVSIYLYKPSSGKRVLKKKMHTIMSPHPTRRD